jgi:hypothetical protein
MSLMGATLKASDSLPNVAWPRVSITYRRRQLQANIFDNNDNGVGHQPARRRWEPRGVP